MALKDDGLIYLKTYLPTEYFIPPEDDVWEGFHQEWISTAWNWLKDIGLREDLMGKVSKRQGERRRIRL